MNGVRSRGSERSREWTARRGDARHHVMIEPGVRLRQLQSEDRHVPPNRQIHRPLGVVPNHRDKRDETPQPSTRRRRALKGQAADRLISQSLAARPHPKPGPNRPFDTNSSPIAISEAGLSSCVLLFA